ncbi:Isoquinoline 1-oxidoreductase subunit alpha [Luteitalea pratensis]|uniref:Isoquinoline 1-oxidoreductase subunit alpha n=1 Tax=Luteitalea pratensis TaxID=1855912 RepID=A0A143PU84_LUTPR|nr:(2Fe-2S)-binding protein [Luteitalea pratensis]AMY11379.1 Isoquinoline 1-oxidoreductase subunit alpha [Luteitalea pratensis]
MTQPSSPATSVVRFSVNGEARTFEGDAQTPLLWVLRDTLKLTGTKYSCGIGLCGACTVHMDGQPVRACATPVSSVAGKKIVTIEGLAPADDEHPLQTAWKKHQVPQCGYCQSGQIMQAAALLATRPNATEAQIETYMEPILCRCGTYQRIRAAIKDAQAAGRQG